MTKFYLLFAYLLFSICSISQNLSSISPNTANAGQSLNVTITGSNTHFVQTSGTSVSFNFSQTSGTSIVNSVNILNDTILSANITVPSTTAPGNYNVTTSNIVDGTLSLASAFHVNAPSSPSLTSISPSSANAGQSLSVTITGSKTHFSQALSNSVSFSFFQTTGTTIVQSVNVINDSLLLANITVPSNIVTGYYNANVQNSIDGFISLVNGFHVTGITQPSLKSVNPTTAQIGQSLNVTITGSNTHFAQGGGVVDFTFLQTSGTVVVPFVNSTNIVNDTSIITNITIPQNATIGNYNLRIYNTTDGYLYNNFYVQNNCFSHYATTYDSLNNQFTLILDSATIASASSYHWDFGDGSSSNLQTPNHTFTKDSTYNVCLKVITASGDSCSYCHVIGIDSSGVVLKQSSSGFQLNVVLYNVTITNLDQIVKNQNIDIALFPNPTNNVFSISLLNQSIDLKNSSIKIYTIDGKLIIQDSIKQKTTLIDLSDNDNGVYLVKIETPSGNRIVKLFKQ